VDHLAYALTAGQMPNFVLFYRALFGLEPQPALELSDPLGLVQSRVVSNPPSNVRLALNVSESRHTETGRFLSAAAGTGVHHLALRTSSVGAFVSKHGVPSCEDLEARFEIEPATLAKLENRNVLYDRSEAGASSPTPTPPRSPTGSSSRSKGDYTGFGAPNAAVRLAAQARYRLQKATAA
jgi:4-hydroxyphenylpyruvate dioxygenase